MKRLLRSTAIVTALALAGCSSDPATFTTFTHRGGSPKGVVTAAVAPHYTDALALNYANFVESEFRARATGARYSREGTNTALAGLSGFTAAAGTLAYSASTVTGLGMATAGIVELQHIFDAKGRSNAYSEAALRIHSAIKDFVALNLNHVSDKEITANGWTLANIVQANADMVNKVLNGHLPTPEDLIQATEPMTTRGATSQATGTTPANNIPASTMRMKAPLPAASPRETRDPNARASNTNELPAGVVRARKQLSAWVDAQDKAGNIPAMRQFLTDTEPEAQVKDAALADTIRDLIAGATTPAGLRPLLVAAGLEPATPSESAPKKKKAPLPAPGQRE